MLLNTNNLSMIPLMNIRQQQVMRVLRQVFNRQHDALLEEKTSVESAKLLASSLLSAMGVAVDPGLLNEIHMTLSVWVEGARLRRHKINAMQHGGLDEIFSGLLNSAAKWVSKEDNLLVGLLSRNAIGDENIVKFLKDNTALDPNFRVNGEAAIFLLAQRGYLDSLRILLARGADSNGKNNKGIPYIGILANEGKHAAVRLMLEFRSNPNVIMPKQDIRFSNNTIIRVHQSKPLIFQLIERAMPEMLELFLQAGGDVNQTVEGMGKPITQAVFSAIFEDDGTHKPTLDENAFKCIELLLKYGADPSPHWQQTKTAATPCHYAALCQSPRIMDLLMDYGADFTVPAHPHYKHGPVTAQALFTSKHGRDSEVAQRLESYVLSASLPTERALQINSALVHQQLAKREDLPAQVGTLSVVQAHDGQVNQFPNPLAVESMGQLDLADISFPNPDGSSQPRTLKEIVTEALTKHLPGLSLNATSTQAHAVTPALAGDYANPLDPHLQEACCAQYAPGIYYGGDEAEKIFLVVSVEQESGKFRCDKIIAQKGQTTPCLGLADSPDLTDSHTYACREIPNLVASATVASSGSIQPLTNNGLVVVMLPLDKGRPLLDLSAFGGFGGFGSQSDSSPLMMGGSSFFGTKGPAMPGSVRSGTGVSAFSSTAIGDAARHQYGTTTRSGSYCVGEASLYFIHPVVVASTNESLGRERLLGSDMANLADKCASVMQQRAQLVAKTFRPEVEQEVGCRM